jgi:hypothetical protein
MWSRSKVYIRLLSGSTIPDEEDPSKLVTDPNNRPAGDWSEQSVNLVGGEVMLRYYFLTVPKLRPSLGVGFTWLTYPNLYNDPEIPDDQESPPPPIRGQFKTFRQVVDFGPQIEPGVQLDINRWFGIFLRVPIMFAANPKRLETHRFTETEPIFTDADAVPGGKAPFGIVRAVIGVQGRLFGMPVQPKHDYDDMLEEDVELAPYDRSGEQEPAASPADDGSPDEEAGEDREAEDGGEDGELPGNGDPAGQRRGCPCRPELNDDDCAWAACWRYWSG